MRTEDPMTRTRSLVLGLLALSVGAGAVLSVVWVTNHRDSAPVPQATRIVPMKADAIERNEQLSAMRREQAGIRDQLARAIDDADKQIAESKDAAKIRVANARRELLEVELDALEATPDEGWDTLRPRIEKTLGAS
jgi:hypothetical protein